MRAIKITYWTATAIVALMMVYSAYAYLSNPLVQQGFVHLGYPSHFRIELAVAKIIGALVLLAPVAGKLKEWAYAGFSITFISALIAHTAAGDPAFARAMPLLFLGVLMLSYWAYNKMQKSRNAVTEHVAITRTAA